MSGMNRASVKDASGQAHDARAGDGIFNPIVAAGPDAAYTILVSDLQGGILQATPGAARVYTTPTAAQILAAFPNMDIGDSFIWILSSLAAFALTVTAAAGVTVAGRAAANNSSVIFAVTRTGAATVTFTGL